MQKNLDQEETNLPSLLIRALLLILVIGLVQCTQPPASAPPDNSVDYSGVYCLNIQNLEMTLLQTGESVSFSLSSGEITGGTGTVVENILQLTGFTVGAAIFSSSLTFSTDSSRFSGSFTITDPAGMTAMQGVLLGERGECPEYNIAVQGVPRFVPTDFTQLEKIEQISKFRSGFGHSFTDGLEECRSMKHYYNPSEIYRRNNEVKIFSPVTGTITSVTNDGNGLSLALTNKQIQVQPDDQPAFTFILFHVDLLDSTIISGLKVHAGDHIGYARMFFEDLGEVSTSFDIAVWVNTPSGPRLISYFETLADAVFNAYISRGVASRQDFIITQEFRDGDPLICDGESFQSDGTLENWVILH